MQLVFCFLSIGYSEHDWFLCGNGSLRMETNSETRLIKGSMLSLSFFFLSVIVLVFACACVTCMRDVHAHARHDAEKLWLRYQTFDCASRAQVCKSFDTTCWFCFRWPTRPVVPLSETSVGLGVYVGNNPERFIGDVRWAKNHSALERSSCSCELFAIRNCFPLIVRRTRTYARTSRFTTFHLSFPFTYLTNLSVIRRIPSRSIIHLYVQKTKQSIGRSFISDLSFSGFGCI